MPRSTWAFVALAIAFGDGCGKSGDSAKMMVVYNRWENGFKDARPCLIGGVDRSADPSIQVDLTELYDGGFSQCPGWFLDDAPMPQLEGWKDESELRKEGENVINVWTQLANVDVSQEILDKTVEISNKIKPLQKCITSHCPDRKYLVLEVMKLRAQLRAMLDLPVAEPAPTLEPAIVDRTPAPGAGRPPNNELKAAPEELSDTWQLVRERGVTVRSKSGSSQTLDPDTTGRVVFVRDAAPIVSVKAAPVDEDAKSSRVRVYQLIGGGWHATDIPNAFNVTHAKRRLDVMYAKKVDATDRKPVLTWARFEPATKPQIVYWRYYSAVDRYTWACSSDEALWLATAASDDAKPMLERLMPKDALNPIPTSKDPGPALNFVERDIFACTGNAVWLGTTTELVVCDESPTCRSLQPPISGEQMVYANNAAVSARASKLADNDSRQQLVLVRARQRNNKLEEHIIRLPSGSRFEGYFSRDDKVIGTVKGPKSGEVELY